ncbi:hypothetical protein [Tenacibaculum sp.]|uniref:hypothetical protein n=1 Tax=Tenacibaculum sp. TaxID=1906242 RepID=UPI003AA9A716
MKKETILGFLFLGVLLVSCKQNAKNEIKEVTVLDKNRKEIKIDTTLIRVADLPFHIDSTLYLIHPIGYVKSNMDKSYFLKSSSSEGVYHLTNSYENQLNGMMTNLKFQKIDSDVLTSLTRENIKISSVEFLRTIFDKTKQQILLYKVIDADTNDDKKLGLEDDTSLYISKINGSGFKKISRPNQKLLNTQLVEVNNRLYFKTLHNVKSEKNEEKIHYFYIDLTDERFKAIEYYPVND